MKKLNKFLDKASLWKVYIFGFITMTIMCFIIWCLMDKFILDNGTINFIVTIKISIAMGAITGLMFTLMQSMIRRSNVFWDNAKILEDKADKAETKAELKELFDNDFKELKRMSQGGPHYSEIARLYAIINTKYKCIK